MNRRSIPPRYVVCIRNSGYRVSLVVRRLYRRLPDPAAARQGLVRVVDESGEDYLYPSSLFAEIKVPAAVSRLLRTAS
jgi:hypothetical protein